MISKDVQKKIRHIQIYTKRLLSGSLVGQSSSAVKGSGFEFDQIREYQQGDDVRFIDWKSSARMQTLMIRQYIEERSRCILLAVDISASTYFGSSAKIKHDMIAEIAGVLALAADYAKDRVALLLFSDEVELFIPPNSGQQHVQHILEQLFSHEPAKKKTSISKALEYVAKLRIANLVLFFISDFIGQSFTKPLRVVAKKSDMVAVRCLDKNEHTMPHVGFLSVVDSETGQTALIDTRSAASPINEYCGQWLYDQNRLFANCNVDLLDIKTTQAYIDDMIRFFKKRMLY